MTEGQLYAYEKFWLAVVDERILREAATKKGYNEGWEKGKKEGWEKGKMEGWEKGKMEGFHLVARNMKQLGISIADIAKATGLSEKEIANL